MRFQLVCRTLPSASNKRPDLKDLKLRDAHVLHWLDDQIRALRNGPMHGNRTLRDDQLFIVLLLSFLNPIVRSLRLIEDCGTMNGRLELDRICKSTSSDALAAFNPEKLQPIIEHLRRRVPQLSQFDDSLAGITQRIIAADGTYLTTFADVAWALTHAKRDGRKQAQVRLNTQIDARTWVPQVISVRLRRAQSSRGKDDGSEPDAFTADLLKGVLYVFDRNFVDFDFLNAVLEKDNQFVLRVRASAPAATTVRERALTEADTQAGVVCDKVVTLGGRDAPAGEFRLVEIHTTNRSSEPEIIRLLTSLGDTVPAHVVAAIYRKRWQIELFFKWLKCWAGFGHCSAQPARASPRSSTSR